MYSIGEFSRISSITVKALRLYHDKGILEPSYIDAGTNYRYYGKGDIEKARVITVLKSMHFSLSEIQETLAEIGDESDITQILTEKRDHITREISRLSEVSSAIDSILIKETEAAKMAMNSNDVMIKELAEVSVVATRWQGSYSDTGEAMKKIYKAGGRHASGPALNLYFDGEYKENAQVESCLPVRKKVDCKLECKCLDGGLFATLVHVGPYETIGSSYAQLFEFINANGKKSSLPIREVYHKGPGMLFKGNPEKYVTEIQIPIAEA